MVIFNKETNTKKAKQLLQELVPNDEEFEDIDKIKNNDEVEDDNINEGEIEDHDKEDEEINEGFELPSDVPY